MGAACCVAARDATLPNRSLGENLCRNGRYSPPWSFRRDNRCRVAGEIGNLPHQPCSGASLDGGAEMKGWLGLDTGNVLGGGTPSGSLMTPTPKKFPAYEGVAISLTPSGASSLSNRFTAVNNATGSPEISETLSTNLPSSIPSPSFSIPRAGPSRRARRSPGHQLFRQISASRILGPKSRSIDLRACGACSKMFPEGASVVGDEVPVVAVLACGHVYHAECLENMTPEVNKFDPACPVCTAGEKRVLKTSGKGMKAEEEMKMRFHKRLRNRVVDSYFDSNLDRFEHGKSSCKREEKFQKTEPTSGSTVSSGKPFLKRHFSLGTKWIRSTS